MNVELFVVLGFYAVVWQYVTDVLGKPIDPTCNGLLALVYP
jgi:hypothetical protein